MDEIIWADAVMPPFHHIAEGPDKGEGITDNIVKLMREQLPEFRHIQIIVPVRRFVYMIKQQPSVCNPTFKKTLERSSYICIFRYPVLLFPQTV